MDCKGGLLLAARLTRALEKLRICLRMTSRQVRNAGRTWAALRFTTELSAARDSASRDQPGEGLKRVWQGSRFR